MTLSNFWSMCYSVGKKPPMAVVFSDEDSVDEYVHCEEGLSSDGGFQILFVLCSDRSAEGYLKKEYADAEVVSFRALTKDKIAICVNINRHPHI